MKIKKIIPHPSPQNPIQYLIEAKRMKKKTIEPKVTLLMLTFNTWEYTKQAIDSIFENTKTPFQLIVIDNGSKDQTTEELRANDDIILIENTRNLGFAAGFNQALGFVKTPYFTILNSDIVVGKNWLSNMIEVMESEKDIAIVGPRSNYVSGPQLDKTAQYTTEKELQDMTIAYSNNQVFPARTLERIVFFCTLLKTDLISEIGGLDERFGIGNFEDDDYCRRAINAGYKCAIADNTFVHHYGSRTFEKCKVDYKKLMEENRKKYIDKWAKKGRQ